ncbi:hypothetical protein LCGC14_2346600 [marine sediment metagenome]|uniref:Uncharacterized protein n=1 Tax=marine sediment metagenome TaxID=412755 RepID=A0A0F9CXY7_9ZZZZ
MTFQERWAEGPPVGPAEVGQLNNNITEMCRICCVREDLRCLCHDYLILWDRNKELEAEVKKLAAAVPHNLPYYGRG